MIKDIKKLIFGFDLQLDSFEYLHEKLTKRVIWDGLDGPCVCC